MTATSFEEGRVGGFGEGTTDCRQGGGSKEGANNCRQVGTTREASGGNR